MPRKVRPMPPASPISPTNPDGQQVPEAAVPRSRQQGTGMLQKWEGCPLVYLDEGEVKHIPTGAQVGLKIDLIGWPDIGDEIPGYRTMGCVPLAVLQNIDELGRDNIHRMFGACILKIAAWTLSATGGLGTVIKTRTHTFDACEFDDARPSDPEDPEDDIGSTPWTIPQAHLAQDPQLKEERDRRNDQRRRSRGNRRDGRGGGGFHDDAPRGRGRGGSDRERAPRFNGKGDPMDDHGFDDGPEMPDEMLDPSWVPPAAPPGLVWAWDAYKLHWKQYPASAVTATPVVATPPTPPKAGFFDDIDPTFKTLLLTGAATLLKGLFDKATAAPPDPIKSTVEMVALLNGNKADPEALRKLDIDAEDRRAAAALAAQNAATERENARIEAARLASEAQRQHDVAMENARREAARLEAIAAEDRAAARAIAARNDLIALRALGMDPAAKPQRTEEEIRAAMKAEIRAENLERELAALRGTGDIATQIKRAEGVLKAAGIDIDGSGAKGMMMEFFNTKAGEVAVGQGLGIVDRLTTLLMGGGKVADPSQAPMHTQVTMDRAQLDADVRRLQAEAYERGVAEARQRLAAEQAALAAQPHAPTMEGFTAVEAPTVPPEAPAVSDAAPVEEVPPLAPEAPAEPAPTPRGEELPETLAQRSEREAAEFAAQETTTPAEPAPEAPVVESTGAVSLIDRDAEVAA